MMMRMLEAGGLEILSDEVRRPDQDNPAGYYESERVKHLKDGDDGWLESARGRGVKVVSPLLQHLPSRYSYKVIFMTRTMSEILASQQQMLVRVGHGTESASDDIVAAAFARHLRTVEAWLGHQPNIEALYVNYGHVLERPRRSVLAINAFLGDRLVPEAMLEVIDPSLYRQKAAPIRDAKPEGVDGIK